MVFVCLLISAMACNLLVELTIGTWAVWVRKIFISWLPVVLDWVCIILAVVGGLLLVVRIVKAEKLRQTIGTFILALFSASVLGVIVYLSSNYAAIRGWIVWFALVCAASAVCFVLSLLFAGLAQRRIRKTGVSQ